VLPLATRSGVVVVDDSLNLLASNSEAIQILTFPERPEKIPHLDEWISGQIRARILDGQISPPPIFPRELQSSRRTYLCRTFSLNCGNGNSLPLKASMAIFLERRTNGATKLAEISQRYSLTTRELETVQLLLQGLTSKEIAQRMKISPNTVKAFIRLVMVKMNVSTRSGIIGKIVGPKG
jgi:DNA-binding CsgD family transcriptional regulator